MAWIDEQPISASDQRKVRARAGRPRREPIDFQRTRILSAMIAVACERGVQSLTVGSVIVQAGVSRKTFYELFAGRDDCLLEALEWIIDRVEQRVRGADASEWAWVDRIRIHLRIIIEFLDEQPALARLCVVDSLTAGPAALAFQRELLGEIARAVDEGRGLARHEPPPLVAESIVGGVFEVIHSRLLRPDGGALLELLGPFMGFIVLPYLGAAAARRELDRPLIAPPPRPGESESVSNPVEGLRMRVTYRTVKVLVVIAAQPGLSNAQIGERAGVRDQGQISKLLARLAALGLVENIGPGHRGAANAWRLTPRGEVFERATRREQLPLTLRRELQSPGMRMNASRT